MIGRAAASTAADDDPVGAAVPAVAAAASARPASPFWDASSRRNSSCAAQRTHSSWLSYRKCCCGPTHEPGRIKRMNPIAVVARHHQVSRGLFFYTRLIDSEKARSSSLTFISREPMFVNQIRANQRSRPAQPGLAMNRDGPSLRDDAVREVDKPATHLEGRVGPVVKVHLDVIDPATDKVDRVVQLLVQPAGGWNDAGNL